jgi:hypothetical protein
MVEYVGIYKLGEIALSQRFSNKPMRSQNNVWAYWLLLENVWAAHMPIIATRINQTGCRVQPGG